VASFEPGPLLRVFIMGQLTGALLEQEFSAAGLSRKDFAITSSLRLMQPTTPTALAEQLGMPLTTMSAAARRIERRGHLRRVPNPADGRSHLLELTPAGVEAVEAAFPAFDAALGRLRVALGDDWNAVAAGLARFEEALRQTVASTAATSGAHGAGERRKDV
jgi:DNA-binding MarR family transcriptional regulator